MIFTGDNPQYKLELTSCDSDAVVWILLTRHITQKVCSFCFERFRVEDWARVSFSLTRSHPHSPQFSLLLAGRALARETKGSGDMGFLNEFEFFFELPFETKKS